MGPMSRTIYSLCTNGKYPAYYPAMLAESLKPYKVDLICLVDGKIDSYPSATNLHLMDVRLFVPDNMRFHFSGWWYKMLFFNPEHFPDRLFFIDIDSICTSDPAVMWFECNDNNKFALRTTMDWIRPKQIASPLMFIDHRRGHAAMIWDKFYGLSSCPGGGDQDFIGSTVDDLFGDFKAGVHKEFPKKFMMSYKVWFSENGSRYSQNKPRFGPMATTDFLFFTFHGRLSIIDVVNKKLPGYEMFEEFVGVSA